MTSPLYGSQGHLVGVMRLKSQKRTVQPGQIHSSRTSTEEVVPMSIPDNELSNGRVKTLGIRFEPDIHADMTLIASLRGTSFQAEVLEACRSHVATVKASPELASKADDALAEIEREAAARREAFARLFGTTPDLPGEASQPSPTDPVFPITSDGLAAAVEHERTTAATAAATPAPTTSRKSTGARGGDNSKS